MCHEFEILFKLYIFTYIFFCHHFLCVQIRDVHAFAAFAHALFMSQVIPTKRSQLVNSEKAETINFWEQIKYNRNVKNIQGY